MTLYQVRDWDANFENNKSRERDECSFVCVPNKQHGLGFSRIMAEKDGAAIYGIWILILGACSRQQKPRDGWLADDGQQSGTPWAPDDLAIQFRRPIAEIERALSFLSSAKIGWIVAHEATQGEQLASSARSVPAQCPLSALEEKGIEEKRILAERASIIYDCYPKKAAKPKAIKSILKAFAIIAFDDLLAKTKAYAAAVVDDDPQYIPHPATWFNQERFNDDPATWRKGSPIQSRPMPATLKPFDF